MNMPIWWMPYAALALQLWLPLAMALFGRIPGNKAYLAAMLGAGIGFTYGWLTQDLVTMAAEICAAVAFTWIRLKAKPAVTSE